MLSQLKRAFRLSLHLAAFLLLAVSTSLAQSYTCGDPEFYFSESKATATVTKIGSEIRSFSQQVKEIPLNSDSEYGRLRRDLQEEAKRRYQAPSEQHPAHPICLYIYELTGEGRFITNISVEYSTNSSGQRDATFTITVRYVVPYDRTACCLNHPEHE